MNNVHHLPAAAPDPSEPFPGLPMNPGRRQRRAAETRLRLFRAAVQLFSERGCASVTVEQITEAADVGKGTFFNYFKSKVQVLGVMAEIQLARIGEIAPLVSSGQHSMRTLLRRLAHKLAEEPGRSPELARALISAFLGSPDVREILNARIAEGRTRVASLIEQGQQRGEIDPCLKKEALAEQFQQAVMGTILLWTLHGGPTLETRIETSFQHFWRAVAARGREQEI